jgi:hypothetical protein
MKMPNAQNDYGSEGNFLPGAWTLMDILTTHAMRNGYVWR